MRQFGCSQTRATRQSRFTVTGDIFNISAISSTLNPPKKRRMALGAARGRVLRMILRESALVVLMVSAVGLPISPPGGSSPRCFTARRPRIWQPSPTCTTLVLAGTVAAALVPERRAARTDPMAALRYE